jgi:hypothetical protein
MHELGLNVISRYDPRSDKELLTGLRFFGK